MKKTIFILMLTLAGVLTAQTNYEKGMKEAFELWESGKLVEASNLFERIANAEPNNWLPTYYAAQINIVNSFGEKNENKLTTQLDKAQELLDKATSISENNSEIMVMQALLHTAWVAYDGATYGMTLSGKVVAIYTKALQLAPENPRAMFSKAEWDIGGARYFGQDIKPFCQDIEKSLELFANFKPETNFHPSWGKERAEQVLANCK